LFLSSTAKLIAWLLTNGVGSLIEDKKDIKILDLSVSMKQLFHIFVK
jgi:hypothetical protein